MSKNYAIYDRSAVKSRDGSHDVQRIDRCKAIVSAVGGSVRGVFEDIGVSGREGANAPARDRLMESVKAGEIDYVVVSDLARLSRCMTTIADITSEMEAAGVELMIAHDSGCDNDPE